MTLIESVFVLPVHVYLKEKIFVEENDFVQLN